jgi:CubicO group peptidase (beta-lactamase class C family)
MFRKPISALLPFALFVALQLSNCPVEHLDASAAVVNAARLTRQDARADRIARVEHGLLPRAVTQGQTGKPMTIAARMAYHGIPGMSIAVIDDGRVAWARAYGVRDRNRNTPIDIETLFQAASLSKPVTAFGAMLLVQQKRLELDGDVNQWLQPWKAGTTITLRQLLSHTAGMNVDGFSGYGPGARLPTITQILNGESPANNEPIRAVGPVGTKVLYSGGGYVIVQQLLANLTQSPFEDYMRREVFTPLGMTHSTFRQPLPVAAARNAAAGHQRNGSQLAGGAMTHPELAAAGLWSTPSDLAQLVIELQDALADRPARALKIGAAREILSGRVDNAGLGVFLAGSNGPSRRFTHSGRNAGFDSRLVAYKNGRQGAVIMINQNNNEGFIDEVLESVAREYGWPDYVSAVPQAVYVEVPTKMQASYAGVYESETRPALTIVFENDKLFARPAGGTWFRLYPSSPTEFFAIENETRWTFVKGPGGEVTDVVARTGDREVRRRRVR